MIKWEYRTAYDDGDGTFDVDPSISDEDIQKMLDPSVKYDPLTRKIKSKNGSRLPRSKIQTLTQQINNLKSNIDRALSPTDYSPGNTTR